MTEMDLTPQTPREQMLYEWGIFNGLSQADYLLSDWDDPDTAFADDLKEIRYSLDEMREKRGKIFAAAAQRAEA